ncbi:MAG TPA: nucleotidyltransferase domain-containing protein [Nitrosopumilaceae archaeon]|nr:nucleotidyltransferase domain-containing protein [Nitrosopumilaceae archaeon]
MNNHSLNRNGIFINTEHIILQKVGTYLEKKGWKIFHEVKLRGRIVDIIATKDDKITAIEVKGGSGDIQRGIEQALHQKNTANFSYLAIPKDRSTKMILNSCQSLGIGLLLVNDEVKEVVKPVEGNVLPSVKNIVFKERKRSQQSVSIKSSLESLFRSRAQVLILKLLFLNSSSEFHANDMARKTGLAPSTIAKEMPVIQNIGLVLRRTQGNLVFYKINNQSVIYNELKRIFLKFEMLDEIISRDLPKEKIKYALIYGSFAKGTESQSSDIDLLVIGDVNEDALLRSVSKTERTIGREINYLLWKEKEFMERVEKKIPLMKEISRTRIMMIIGDEDEFKRLVEAR